MRKYMVLLLAAALLCAGAAHAETDQFANAYELYSYWYSTQTDWTESAYPDYVCGVWSSDGGMDNLTIAVLEGAEGEAGKAEILDAVADDSTLTFAYQKYSHAELRAIQEELTPFLGDKTGAQGIGVDEMGNTVSIYINTDAPGAEAFMAECFETYGDRIMFEGGSGVFVTTEDTTAATRPNLRQELGRTSSAPLLWALTALFAVFCIGPFLLARHRLALQTADGRTVTAGESLSRSEVEAAVRESQTPPPPETLQTILRKIDE